jgi:hypothetical protein
MLTHAQIVTLYRSLRDQRVLSIYIDGTAADPAIQRAWRLQLEHGLKDVRVWLDDAPRDERESFERCARLLEGELASFNASVGAPGWVAFITADGTHDAHPLPVPVPTLAVWSTGLCVAPYMRALQETRPVVVAVVDARKADLYRYRVGKLDRIEKVRAHHAVEQPSHMGTQPRLGFHSGTRGTAGQDAAQRTLLEGRDRMLADAVERIGDLAGHDGWILLGGIRRVVAALSQQLAPLATDRVLEVGSLDVHASEAEIVEAARTGASALNSARDSKRIAAIADQSGARGLGVLGPAGVQRALEQGSVHELYLTHRYLEDHAADSETAVRSALDQDASVEEVSGPAADFLDERGGLAAGLRFRPANIDGATRA